MEKLIDPATPVCDLDAALDRLGGDYDLLCDLISFYLEDYPSLLEELREADPIDDSRSVIVRAYRLKGLAANFDAAHVTSAASAVIEQLPSEQDEARALETAQAKQLRQQIAYLSTEAMQLGEALKWAMRERLACR